MHNFFDAIYVFSDLWWRGLLQDRRMHKKRRKCRAQVTGEQPTRQGAVGDAFKCHASAFPAFCARFLASGCVAGSIAVRACQNGAHAL